MLKVKICLCVSESSSKYDDLSIVPSAKNVLRNLKEMKNKKDESPLTSKARNVESSVDTPGEEKLIMSKK